MDFHKCTCLPPRTISVMDTTSLDIPEGEKPLGWLCTYCGGDASGLPPASLPTTVEDYRTGEIVSIAEYCGDVPLPAWIETAEQVEAQRLKEVDQDMKYRMDMQILDIEIYRRGWIERER